MREHAAFLRIFSGCDRRLRALHALSLVLVLACASLASACGGGLVPVLDIHNSPVVVRRGETATPAYVRDAIIRALASRKWQLDREGPDGIVATVVSGAHSATVHIRYDERTYSIEYLDSSPSLRFDGGYIHRRYNDWVDRLNRAIRANLRDRPWVQGGPQLAPPSAPAQGPTPAPAPGATEPPTAAPPPPAAPPPAVAPAPPAHGPGHGQPVPPDELPPPPPPPPTAPRK